mgnify:CR=1 FL=1
MAQEITIKCPNCKSNVPIGYSICPYCGFDLRPIIRLRAKRELTKHDILLRFKKAIFRPWIILDDIVLAPDNLGPLLIILLLSIITTIRTLISFHILAGDPLLFGAIKLTLFLPLLMISSLCFFICLWIIASFILNTIFRLLGASTDISLTMSLLGYAVGPLIIFSLISTLIISSVTGISVTSPEIGSLLLSNTLIIASQYIMLLGFLLAAYVISMGASKAYFLNRYLVFIILACIIVSLYLLT